MRPASASCITAVHVNSLVTEPMRNIVRSGSTGLRSPTFAQPYPFDRSSSPSRTTETVAPAMCLSRMCATITPSRNASSSAASVGPRLAGTFSSGACAPSGAAARSIDKPSAFSPAGCHGRRIGSLRRGYGPARSDEQPLLRGRCRARRPDLRQHAREVAAEDAPDRVVAVAAADERLGHVEHALRVIDALDVDLVAERVAVLVAGLEPRVVLGRHVVIAVQVDVAADAEVLYADQVPDIVEVIDVVLDRGRLDVAHEVADARDAHDAARLRHRADRLVRLGARMTVHQ